MKALLAATAVATACVATTAAAQTLPKTHLNVVGNIGITTQFKELEQPFWTKEVPAASNGAVTAQIKPWNEMGLKGNEVFKMLRQGLFDVGTTQMGFLSGDSALNDATDLAGAAPTIEQFLDATSRFRPVIESHYEKQNLKVLGLWSFQAQVLYCRGELKGLQDLKGRKVRVSGASQADFVEYFGGAGVNMAFGEVQQALQNGVIDCAITGTLGGYKAKWHDGARYLYPLPINWGSVISAMNMNAWKKLDPSVQKLLQQQYARLEKDVFEQNKRENDIGIACNTGSGPCSEGDPAKMTLVPVSQADLELRKKAVEERVLPRWADRCGAECARQWNETVGKALGLTAKK